MKYSVQEMHQALKDGKCFWFYHIDNTFTLYKACLVGRDILVTWEGGQTRYTFSPNPKCLNYWICTKIEGEETMEKKTPHKHAELIKKWADGAIIQLEQEVDGGWVDTSDNRPSWVEGFKYRVKPTLVKKWNWVYEETNGKMMVTALEYSSPEEFYKLNPYAQGKILQKVDSTMQEVEE